MTQKTSSASTATSLPLRRGSKGLGGGTLLPLRQESFIVRLVLRPPEMYRAVSELPR
jgi:hypothetical protein